jgi:hypothetical protein
MTGGSNTHQNKGKNHVTQPNFKRPQQSNFGQNTFGSHGSFGSSGHKGASNSKGPWGQSKDAKANFKGPSKSTPFKKMKRDHQQMVGGSMIHNLNSFALFTNLLWKVVVTFLG